MARHQTLATAFALATALPQVAHADENGISFWLPGLYGSFAATPTTPGWTRATVYYHASVDAGTGQQFPRGGRVDVGLQGRGNIVAFGPTLHLKRRFSARNCRSACWGLPDVTRGQSTQL